MKLRWPKADSITVEIIGASPADILTRINDLGISLYDAEQIDELTVNVQIKQDCYDRIQKEIARCGGACRIIEQSNTMKFVRHLYKRIVLVVGIAILVLGVLYLPTRVLFIKVSGNTSIPTNLIIDKAHTCGIRFGASRKNVRSEEIKNALITEIPSLQWVGVNTDGCVAVISVREKSDSDAIDENSSAVSNIIAKRDGIVVSRTVLRGTPLCEAGQAVIAGQILVSGYYDCGICIQATQAQAEVLAQTKRSIKAVSPVRYLKRGDVVESETRFRLVLGKKLINLYKDSGISDGTCVKICEKNYLSLPGGFALPICLITERIYRYKTYYAARETNNGSFDWLEDFSSSYLLNEMIAGQILTFDANTECNSDFVCFTGQYDCIEMIGQTKAEENIVEYGFND